MPAVPMGLRGLDFQVILSIRERIRAAILDRVNAGRIQSVCGSR